MLDAERPAVTVIIAAHAPLATAMLAGAEAITGTTSALQVLDLALDEAPAHYTERLASACATGSTAVVLADLYGGTPWQSAVTLMRQTPPVVALLVAGANLALVLEAAVGVQQGATLEHIAQQLRTLAPKSIVIQPHGRDGDV